MNRADLDATDRRILEVLQADGTLSAAEVAARVGATATTCWRRINQLEQAGVIRARVALLDRAALGLDVTIFAHVKLASQGRDALARFEQAIRDHPCVLECYTVMGEWDFLLHIVAHDIKEYEAFYLDHLSRIPLVQSVNSTMVVTALKKTTVLPLEHGAPAVRPADGPGLRARAGTPPRR
ncbi:MAG: Lrp/AsnC family transcriptional regulator [Steroidobacteraceae bacterium]